MPHWRARYLPLGVSAFIALQSACAIAQDALKPIQIDPSLAQRPRTEHLEVIINDTTTRQNIEVTYDPASQKLTTKRSELEIAGVRVPGTGPPEQEVLISQLGYSFRRDETEQKLIFNLTDEQRQAREYDARRSERPPTPTVDPGFLLNYSLFGGTFQDNLNKRLQFSGGNISFDARAFSKLGVFSQTAIIGTTLYREGANILRLESTYTFSLSDSAITARAGDFISNGTNWTRPVRMGGAQIQRDFTLRSDIVTRPIPVVSGSAAAPSTVDVFINGLKAYSQDVGSGPYRLSNLPLMAGAGDARVVVRDATGRETETTMPLSNPIRLLRPGLFDFSVEAGFARRNFGILSDDYDKRPIGSATLRRGINPWLTLEAHAEGGAGLANLGIGTIVSLGKYGTFSAAATGSKAGDHRGAQAYLGWDAQFGWFSVSAASQRTFGGYRDLAAVTARLEPQQNVVQLPGGPVIPSIGAFSSVNPPRALDRVSISAPLKFDPGNVTVSFINAQQDNGQRNRIATLSYSRPMPLKANLFVTAFADFGTTRSRGIFAGLNVPILPGIYATSGVTFDPKNGLGGSLEFSKPQPLADNTYGWRIRDVEGANPYRMAQASYRSSYGQIGGQVQQYAGRAEGNLSYDGSVAVMGGGVFLGNKVTSSFAVVDAGKPDIPILQDNREIGRTNMFGKKMVTDLRPFEANSIAIDPAKMPANYDVSATHQKVAPVAKAGVVVNFAKHASQNAGLVIFYGADGKHLRAGLRGRLAAGGEAFIVGYDGQAYVRNLAASNTATIETERGACTATFPYQPAAGQQVVIDKVVCR